MLLTQAVCILRLTRDMTTSLGEGTGRHTGRGGEGGNLMIPASLVQNSQLEKGGLQAGYGGLKGNKQEHFPKL